MIMYDLRAEKFVIRVIPHGENPFCVAYVGEKMITPTDQEKAWSMEVPEGQERFDFLIYYLFDHMLLHFDDPQDLIPMTNRQNYTITEVDERFIGVPQQEEKESCDIEWDNGKTYEVEPIPSDIHSAKLSSPIEVEVELDQYELSPSERWFNYQFNSLDSLISEVTEELDREQEERITKREAWEQGIIEALKEEREWIKPLLEFHVPEVIGPQEFAF